MFTGVCCVSGAYRSRSAVRPRRPVSTNVYAAWHDGTPPRNSAIFWRLVCARPAGALRAVVEEAGEDGGKIREVVAFCTLGTEANVVRRDPQGAELAGKPVKCAGRSADCGGPWAIGQCAQRLQHLLRGHARAARLGELSEIVFLSNGG